MALCVEMEDYWTLDDMEKLTRTFDQLIFINNSSDNQAHKIDGKGAGAALFD